MVVIAVAGGKGGVGKTLITINIAYLLAEKGKVMIIDADVDNPCVVPSVRGRNVNIYKTVEVTRFRPRIVQDKCNLCGKCVEACPEHALALIPNKQVIFIESLCAGCGVCKLVCDQGAIAEDQVVEGYIKYGKVDNIDLIIGELKPGERRSYVIMARLLEGHRDQLKNYDYVIIDSPPGTGAGVFSVLKNSEKYILVTEPTKLGISDLKKILLLVNEKFLNKKYIVVVNKADLSPEGTRTIHELCKGHVVVEIPYSRVIAEAYAKGVPVVLVDNEIRKKFEEIVKEVSNL